MILTITLNPSVDINYKLDQFSLDGVNRVNHAGKTAGGKGLNVAHVLRQLEEETAASGFLGGSLGDFIRKEINNKGIKDFFVEIEGNTRNCIAIIHEGKQTEILESGPNISQKESVDFLERYAEAVQQSRYVTISGSTPQGINDEYYSQLIELAHKFHKPVLLDTKGSLLKVTLQSKNKPYLIKPNQEELGDLIGTALTSEKEILSALQQEIFQGVEWVVVTLGGKGAIVKHRENLYRVRIPKVKVVNPVGSGDSVIAGFAAGLSRGFKEEDLIKFGLAMGTINTLEEKTGSIDVNKINWCLEEMNVEQIVQEFI
ncbi:1-phosphofructokinase [Bacillus sp. REN16]|uniref:1-phosphofructokinase n=1 Tax=Bacillus sp. REN16 TaxID=2887296 RepID=UPI001E3ABFEB|nr:1-phosphofructokinase [Bacillus sp. REN16]MCC3355354.1 1-phosphofructokinase [Bacillus sp. REN16]